MIKNLKYSFIILMTTMMVGLGEPTIFYGKDMAQLENNGSTIQNDNHEELGQQNPLIIVIDGKEFTIDGTTLKKEDGTYDSSKLDLNDRTLFQNGIEDAYLVTIGDQTELVGDKSLKRWVGTWESWENYINPTEQLKVEYPYLDNVWEISYEAYKNAFAKVGNDITKTMPTVEALKTYWKNIATTKGVDQIEIVEENGKYFIEWKDKEGNCLAKDSYTMTGKMLKGFEGAESYVFTADTLGVESDYKYFVTMEAGFEGTKEEPIAEHYHFQYGNSLDDMLLKGEKYNSSDYGVNEITKRPITSNLKNNRWYATVIDEKGTKLSKYNVILAMHKATKWRTICIDGVDVSDKINQEEIKKEDGTYDSSKLDLNNRTFFQNGIEDAYLVTIGDQTELVGDKSLKRWVGTWESWENYINPTEQLKVEYPYLDNVWEISYEAYKNAFAKVGNDITKTMPTVEALKTYWKNIATTKGVDQIEIVEENGKYFIEWKDKEGNCLAKDSYTMTGKMLKGFEGAESYVFTADTLGVESDYKYFVTMEAGFEGTKEEPIAEHYHFQYGNSLDDMLLKGEKYNSSDYGVNEITKRPITSNLKNNKWYATVIDEKGTKLSKYNVILAMHKAEKWKEIPNKQAEYYGVSQNYTWIPQIEKKEVTKQENQDKNEENRKKETEQLAQQDITIVVDKEILYLKGKKKEQETKVSLNIGEGYIVKYATNDKDKIEIDPKTGNVKAKKIGIAFVKAYIYDNNRKYVGQKSIKLNIKIKPITKAERNYIKQLRLKKVKINFNTKGKDTNIQPKDFVKVKSQYRVKYVSKSNALVIDKKTGMITVKKRGKFDVLVHIYNENGKWIGKKVWHIQVN